MLYDTQNPHGGDLYSQKVVLDFSANINPLGTPEAVKLAVMESLNELRNYPDPYCRELVCAISDFEGVDSGRILCGAGAAELIFAFVGALKPRRGLLLAPSFSEYETALRSSGAEVSYHYLKEAEDFRLTEDFLPVLRSFTGDAVILCTPNNPTGAVIEAGLLRKILEICHEKALPLLLDECFLDLTEGEDSCKEYLSAIPELTILKAFTKSYGMAGLRLGYCMSGNADLLRAMAQQSQPWNISTPAQKAGIAALGQVQFVDAARRIIAGQRPELKAGLEALGFRVIPSRTNYLLFRAPADTKEKLLKRGILIRSCGNYPGLDGNWFRIAVKLPGENNVLLEALKEITDG